MKFRTLTAGQMNITEIIAPIYRESPKRSSSEIGHGEELHRIEGWYEQVILPAFKRHNDKHLVSDGALNMSDLRDALFEI